MKALVGAFNQEKALVGGLLRDCEIFGNIRITFVSSTNLHVPLLHGGVESVPDIAGGGHGPRAVVELVHVRRHRQEPGHTCDRRLTRPRLFILSINTQKLTQQPLPSSIGMLYSQFVCYDNRERICNPWTLLVDKDPNSSG